MSAEKSKRVTLADVAEASGMSKASVSLILNNRPGSRLSAAAVKRVREAAERLGYRPNVAAQSLRLGKTRTLGFISDQVTVTRFASAMITGILRAAADNDHTVLITETRGEPAELTKALDQLRQRDVDGLILGFMDSRLRDLPELPEDRPVVLVNSHDVQQHPSVMPDENAAGRQAVERLAQTGARTVALVGALRAAQSSPESYPGITRRFAALNRALDNSPLHLLGQWELEDWNPADGYAATTQLLAQGHRPDALICANDRVAMGVYQALAEHRLTPGADLSVISFDDEVIAGYLRPQLTTIALPYEQMGVRAVNSVLGQQEHSGEQLIDMPLIERQSVRD
ncbi:LacI family DNA-binding transcriptional regulator [Glutamicibacter endophyticus]